jgi:DNA excision repair protein ERCC-4
MTPPRFTIVIDSREQTPFCFGDWPTAPGTLASGDYSIQGLETRCAIERKSLSDLCACVTHERERFGRELLRLRGYPVRAVIVEADLSEVMAGAYRSQVKPAAILGSCAAWQVRYGVPFMFAGQHGAALTLALLRHVYGELETLAAVLAGAGGRILKRLVYAKGTTPEVKRGDLRDPAPAPVLVERPPQKENRHENRRRYDGHSRVCPDIRRACADCWSSA